jgi:hypothetical protein
MNTELRSERLLAEGGIPSVHFSIAPMIAAALIAGGFGIGGQVLNKFIGPKPIPPGVPLGGGGGGGAAGGGAPPEQDGGMGGFMSQAARMAMQAYSDSQRQKALQKQQELEAIAHFRPGGMPGRV